MTTDHYLARHPYAGTGGDRPTPWEVTYTCGGCGEELWTAEEGRGSTPGTPDDALQDHVDALAREAEARYLNHEGWTCNSGGHEPGEFDRCPDCRAACIELADFLAAAGVVDLPQLHP